MKRACVLLAAALTVASLGAQAGVIDRATLLRDLRVLSADDMEGRRAGTAGGAKARAYVIERFEASGLEPIGASFESPFDIGSGNPPRRGVNVVGQIRGTTSPGRYIAVTAHYDHLGASGGQVYNGADDNASGTATLISLVKFFARERPAHSLLVVAFDAEEPGLLGSRAFVAKPPVPLESIVVNVNIDMVGRDTSNRLFAVGTFLNPFLEPYIARVAATAPVRLLMGHDDPGNRRVEDWTKDSDHWSFLQAGVPAVYLGEENYEQHHKLTDDYETILPDFFVGAAETSARLIQEFDRHLTEIAEATPARTGRR